MAITSNPVFRVLVLASPLLFSNPFVLSQDRTSAPPTTANQPSAAQNPSTATIGTIHGIVKAGDVPIPGASVSISPESSFPISTWTDVDGSYSAAITAYGTYTVRVQMAAFANSSQQVVVDAPHAIAQVNFELILLSRAPGTATQPRRPAGQATSQRGFQNLSILQSMTGQDTSGAPSNDVVPAGMPVPGIDPNSATESIAVSGNSSNSFNGMSGDELQQRISDARMQGGGFGGGANGGGGQFGVRADLEAVAEDGR